MDKKKKFKIKKSNKNGCLFKMIWIVFIFFISVILTRYILIGINDMLAIGREEKTVSVQIPENANLDVISNILKDNNIINKKNFFKIYAFVTKSSKGFSQGFYELKTNMDYEEILNHIKNKTNGKDIVEITFREGINLLECSELLSQNGVCSKEEFISDCNSNKFDEKYSFIKNDKNLYYKLEGYLFPDTYQFYKSEKSENIINKFLINFSKKINNIKEKDINKLIIVSSLIQAEAANEKDMYKVASVIYNRLNTAKVNKFGEFGLRLLNIDSTVWYPYRTRQTVPENIINNFKSRYDTYSIEGMPAGPICSPGMEAINAAINPENTEYYYFCHSSSGEAYYAKTNEVHISNLKKAGLI